MNKFKKSVLGLTILASTFSLAGLTACGAPAVKSDVTVYFWHTFGDLIEAEVIRLADEFKTLVKENEGLNIDIKLQYQGGYGDLVDKMGKAYATGNVPTITVAYPDHVANYLEMETSKGDLVVSLDEYINDPVLGFEGQEYLNPSLLGIDDFVPSFIDEGQHYKYEGTYSLPYMKSSEIITYNYDVVDRVLNDMNTQNLLEGYTNTIKFMDDISWSEFMTVLYFINDHRTDYGLVTDDSAPLYYDSDANLFITQCYQRGIPFVSMDENGKGSMDFNNPEAKAMVQEFKQMYDDGILLTKGSNSKHFGSDWFRANKTLFNVSSTGGVGYNDPGPSFTAAACKMPTYTTADKDHQKYVSQGVTLALINNHKLPKDENDLAKKYGWMFMKYLTNEENSISACSNSMGYIPPRLSAYENEDYKEYYNGEDYECVCSKTVIEQINGNYFNYPVFQGTDIAREQVEGIVKQYLISDGTGLDSIFTNAYNTAMKAMSKGGK